METFLFAFTCSEGFSVFFDFSKVIIFNCTLTPHHTARMQVSGTRIISTCGRVFSCLLLTRKTSRHESQCDTEKNIHGFQKSSRYARAHLNTCTHILYKEPCVPLTVHVLFVPSPFDISQSINVLLLDHVKLF